jgi:hypothetical protein
MNKTAKLGIYAVSYLDFPFFSCLSTYQLPLLLRAAWHAQCLYLFATLDNCNSSFCMLRCCHTQFILEGQFFAIFNHLLSMIVLLVGFLLSNAFSALVITQASAVVGQPCFSSADSHPPSAFTLETRRFCARQRGQPVRCGSRQQPSPLFR